MIYLDYGVSGGDPYWANVSLLVQGGADASLTIQDLSQYASSVTIAADAEFDSAQQVFGSNMIYVNPVNLADIPAFTGSESRFGRASGEDYTIEAWVRWPTGGLSNVTIAAALWSLIGPSGLPPIAASTLHTDDGELQLTLGLNDFQYSIVSPDVMHFVQFTVIGNTAYYDLDGVEMASWPIGAWNAVGTFQFQVASLSDPNIQSATYWATPLRVTKGVARARGSVPTAAFPTF